MKKIVSLAMVTLLALAGCGIDGKNRVPDPVPDHAVDPNIQTREVRIDFAARDINNDLIVGRKIIGTAKMIDASGKPMIGTDQKTGVEAPIVLPFKVETNEVGAAQARITYEIGAVKLEVVAILQGYNGDSMLMEVTGVFDELLPLGPGAVEICEITRKGGAIGACTCHADVILI